MKIRTIIFNTWAVMHILIIIVTSIYFAYNKYCAFYKVDENEKYIKVFGAILFNKPMMYYGEISAAQSGYGFFAPNIRSSGFIIGECNGKKILPLFKSFESSQRFSGLSTKVTDYIVNGTGNKKNAGDSLSEKYYDLVFKSIAVKIFNQNNCTADSFRVSYNLIAYPTLKEYAKGDRGYSLIKIKEVNLIKQPQ